MALFFQLFLTFLKIGIFTFGGGYAMTALIQDEVVYSHEWISQGEFTDILAISQVTPGPIGINTATYVGYTAVVNSGYSSEMGVLGALLCSFAVVLLPFFLMMALCSVLEKYKNNKYVSYVLYVLRLVVVGLIASAALKLMNYDNFGRVGVNRHFITSLLIFVLVFFFSVLPKKKRPILLIILSGVVGLLVY